MPKLTVGRMAKLYGLHRSSLYEAIARGRVSCGVDGRGQKVVDLSEMIRVFGEPPPSARHQPGASPTPARQDLEALLEHLSGLVERQTEQIEALREEVAALRALPAPSGPPKPPGKVKSLDDVLSRLESRWGGE